MPQFEEIILDPRDGNEIVEQALIYVANRSNNALNDSSDNSNLRVVYEGFTFCAEELQYYTNKLSKALAVAFLTNLGKTPSNGTKAKCTLRFTLLASLGNQFLIPAQFVVSASDNLRFLTETSLIIPAGQIEGTVTAIAEFVGAAYQLPPGTINNPLLALTGLQAVTNIDQCTGGSDAETEEQAFARIAVELRSFALSDTSDDVALRVTKNDKNYYTLGTREEYEQFVQKLLGTGSFAHAVPNLARDKVTSQPSAVHVFALDASGNAPNEASLADVRKNVSDRTFVGAVTNVSGFIKYPISLTVDANISAVNPQTAALNIQTAFKSYVRNWANQFVFNVTYATIYTNEIEYAIRDLPFVKKINNIGASATPNTSILITSGVIQTTNKFTVLDAGDSIIKVVTPTGDSYTVSDRISGIPIFTEQDFVNNLVWCFEGENNKNPDKPLENSIGYGSGLPTNFSFTYGTQGVADVQAVVSTFTPTRLAYSIYNEIYNISSPPGIIRKVDPNTRAQFTRAVVYYFSISQNKWIFSTYQDTPGAAYAEDFSYLEPSQEVTGADYSVESDGLFSVRSGIGNAAGLAIGQAGGRVANQRISNRGDQVGYNFHGFGTRQPVVWTDVKAIYGAQAFRLRPTVANGPVTEGLYCVNLGFDAWPDLQTGGFNFGFNGGRFVPITKDWRLVTTYAGPRPDNGFVGVGIPPLPVF